jgi:metallo-beta-lactamase family protein
VIAGNWMCSAGRILHHIKHGIWNPKNMLLFVWYQAEGTLGRTILSGEKHIRVLWQDLVVKAEITQIHSFSWHADANQLIKWAQWFTTKPKKVFIVHGEWAAQTTLQSNLQKIGLESYIPTIGETIEL